VSSQETGAGDSKAALVRTGGGKSREQRWHTKKKSRRVELNKKHKGGQGPRKGKARTTDMRKGVKGRQENTFWGGKAKKMPQLNGAEKKKRPVRSRLSERGDRGGHDQADGVSEKNVHKRLKKEEDHQTTGPLGPANEGGKGLEAPSASHPAAAGVQKNRTGARLAATPCPKERKKKGAKTKRITHPRKHKGPNLVHPSVGDRPIYMHRGKF